MKPERIYLQLVVDLLEKIRLISLCSSKDIPIEFSIQHGANYSLQRGIIYKLQDEGLFDVLDEARGDLDYEGTYFKIKLKQKFDEFYNLYQKGESISKKLENEKYWVRASFQDNEIHLLVGDKEDEEGRHVHLILGKNGDIRTDKKDQPPQELLDQVLAITTKDGTKITASLKMEKNQNS